MPHFDRRDHERERSRTAEATGHGRTAALEAGKQTLTSQLPVQQVGERPAATGDAIHAAADHGTSGQAEQLPHLGTIQQLFGAHDVSRIQAHTDPAAREGTQAMGAQAFARGEHVAFAGAPNLHTAAHEAAHVVQQRAGVHLQAGVGQVGDVYEQHADAVADAVVRGEPAEALLDQHAGPSTASAGGSAVQQARGRKRQRDEEQAPAPQGEGSGAQPGGSGAQPNGNDAAISDELGGWLGGEKRDLSYAEDFQVHSIDKGDKTDLACWNWALRGLQDIGGPSPGDFWEHVLDPSGDKTMPDALAHIPEVVRNQLTGITQQLRAARLARRPADLPRKHSAGQQAKAIPIMQQMCETLVTAHGFALADAGAAAATVVCQYKPAEGAAVPEHWWIELPGGIVIQTVNGQPLEVGDTETKWHSEGGRDPESAAEYREIRVPVRALKGEHIAILETAMAAAPSKRRRR